MKNEIIGTCPGCIEAEKSASVEIFVTRNELGEITDMYIFGDDDFDVRGRDCYITKIKLSKDLKTITEVTCPRCKEQIAVNIPVIKKLDNKLTRSSNKISSIKTSKTSNEQIEKVV